MATNKLNDDQEKLLASILKDNDVKELINSKIKEDDFLYHSNNDFTTFYIKSRKTHNLFGYIFITLLNKELLHNKLEVIITLGINKIFMLQNKKNIIVKFKNTSVPTVNSSIASHINNIPEYANNGFVQIPVYNKIINI